MIRLRNELRSLVQPDRLAEHPTERREHTAIDTHFLVVLKPVKEPAL